MRAGEAMAAGFRHTHAAWPVIGLGFAVNAGISLVQKLFGLGTAAGQPAGGLAVALAVLVWVILMGLFWVFWSAGLLGWLKDQLSGIPGGWPRFFETGRRLFWRFIFLFLLEGGMIFGAFAAASLLSVPLFRLSPLLGVPVFLVAFSAPFLLMFLVTYSGVSMVEHDLGAVDSIKDSIRFARSRFWGTACLTSLIILMWVGLTAAVMGPALGLLIFKMGAKEALHAFQGKEVPFLLTVAMDAVNAYGWVLTNAALYFYYMGNRPAPEAEPAQAAA